MDLTFSDFETMLHAWSKAVRHHSNPTTRNRHENRELILNAPNRNDVIGFACVLLGTDECTHEIFSLLYEMVPKDEHPVIPDYYAGRIPVMIECWRYWAMKSKIVSIKYNPEKYWIEDKFGNAGNWH